MKRRIEPIIAILLLLTFLTGPFAGAGAEGTALQGAEDDFVTVNELDGTLKGGTGFQLIEQSGDLELYADGQTTEIAVKVLSTGEMWYSNPLDRDQDPVAEPYNKQKLSSQIDLIYNNEADKASGMNNFADAIDLGQFEFAKIDQGFRVTYEIGKKRKIYVVPQIITAKRFEETVLSKLDDAQREDLLARYNFYSLPEIESEDIKKELLAKFPRLAEEDIYELLPNLAGFVMEKLETIVSGTGYTYADLVQDNEYNGAEVPVPPTTFKIPVDYTIDGESLLASVRTEHIVHPDDVKITDLRFLSFFGAANMTEEGYLFVPDGCGALIRLNNGKSGLPVYRTRLYGEDQTNMSEDRLKITQQSYLPVFGMKKGNSAFLAVIESGDAIASVNASVSGKLNGYNYIYPSFELTTKMKMSVPYWRTNDMNIFQKSRFDQDLSVRYFFLDGEQADYTGMALKYQDYLLKRGQIRKTPAGTSPFYLELTGGVEYRESILGIPATPVKPLTTYAEAAEIIRKLHDGGVGKVVLRYTGWANDGIWNSAMNRIKVQRQLGGAKGLETLRGELDASGDAMFLDVDLQHIYKQTMFDRYNALFDSPKTILGEAAYNSRNNMATGARVTKVSLVTPGLYETYSAYVLRSLGRLGIRGISLAAMSRELYSDFNKKNVIDRQDAYGIIGSVYRAYAENGFSILADRANAYALADASCVTGIPSASNRFYCVDEDIPFYQIVLHGIVPYAEEPANMSPDYETAVLNMMETGSGVFFKWMYMQNKELKKIDTDLYAVSYREWIDEAIGLYIRVNDTLSEVSDARIIGHENLENGVTVTRFDNGITIYVNYGTEAAAAGTLEIPARSWKIEKGAAE